MTFDELDGPYSTIVIDPPWTIEKIRRRVRPRQVTMSYSMMSLDEIAALPVLDLAADPATLFLWTIDKYLFDARPILEGWGFKYHLTMAWDKTNGQAMYGFNRQTEFVLVGFRGAHNAYPSRPTIRTSFSAAASGHSIKPAAFYDMVELLPGPYVDLFCRQPRFGWDSWGYGYEGAA